MEGSSFKGFNALFSLGTWLLTAIELLKGTIMGICSRREESEERRKAYRLFCR
jgi:hypothetical protein